MKNPGQESDDWDAHWARYASAASRNPAQEMRHALLIGLLRRSQASPDICLLDLGSGQGDFCAKVRAVLPQASLVGFELSERGVEDSRRKVPDAVFKVVDLFQPPPALDSYKDWANVAVCSEVLEHVDAPSDFLVAARPFLKDGARLFVTVPGGPMSAFDKHIGHRRHFTSASIREVLVAADFEVERIYMAGFPFFNLYRLAVIARGEKLTEDGSSTGKLAGLIAALTLTLFRFLFRFNFLSTPFGWQVVAVAHKASA